MFAQRPDRVISVCLKKSQFSLDRLYAARSFLFNPSASGAVLRSNTLYSGGTHWFADSTSVGISRRMFFGTTLLESLSDRVSQPISPGWYRNWLSKPNKGGFNKRKSKLILRRKTAQPISAVDLSNLLDLPDHLPTSGMYQVRLKSQVHRNGAADETSRWKNQSH
jgi:hypothetical protein